MAVTCRIWEWLMTLEMMITLPVSLTVMRAASVSRGCNVYDTNVSGSRQMYATDFHRLTNDLTRSWCLNDRQISLASYIWHWNYLKWWEKIHRKCCKSTVWMSILFDTKTNPTVTIIERNCQNKHFQTTLIKNPSTGLHIL